jgi:hypothetical protein
MRSQGQQGQCRAGGAAVCVHVSSCLYSVLTADSPEARANELHALMGFNSFGRKRSRMICVILSKLVPLASPSRLSPSTRSAPHTLTASAGLACQLTAGMICL